MIVGYLINKFRGDVSLFDDGLVAIEKFTGWRCFGIVPWLKAAALLPSEDSVMLERLAGGEKRALKIAVPMLSRIANFDDLDPLKAEPQVEVVFVPPGKPLPEDAGLVIIPGSKSTIGDLLRFRENGWDRDLAEHRRRGGHVVGICGGYQMLGRIVRDPRRHRGQRDRGRRARPARHRDGDGTGKDGAQRRRALGAFRRAALRLRDPSRPHHRPGLPAAVGDHQRGRGRRDLGRRQGVRHLYARPVRLGRVSRQNSSKAWASGAAASTTAPRSSARWTRLPRTSRRISTATRSSRPRGRFQLPCAGWRRIGYAFGMAEVSLYAPVKKFLEGLDFVVKGEIGNCDVVGVREGEPPVVVICELKMQFNLELVLQAVDRAGASDEVWLAAAMSVRGKGREHDSRFRALCRRLGFGLARGDAARRGRVAAQPRGAGAAPQSPEAIETSRRAPPPARRPCRRRQHPLAGDDRLSPGRIGVRGGNVGGTEAAARSEGSSRRAPARSCSTMSMAGSSAPGAASMC